MNGAFQQRHLRTRAAALAALAALSFGCKKVDANGNTVYDATVGLGGTVSGPDKLRFTVTKANNRKICIHNNNGLGMTTGLTLSGNKQSMMIEGVNVPGGQTSCVGASANNPFGHGEVSKNGATAKIKF